MASHDAQRVLESTRTEFEPAPVSPSVSAPSVRRPHWRQMLAGASSREVLARIMNGDPLELRSHVARRLRDRALLLDLDRALLRSFARTARFAVRYRGEPSLDVWLASMVDDALADLQREDAHAARTRAPIDERLHAAFVALATPLGLDPARMRVACAVFNALPEDDRRAFYALVIEGVSLDELARARDRSASELARAARRALDAMLEQVPTAPTAISPSAGTQSHVNEETRR